MIYAQITIENRLKSGHISVTPLSEPGNEDFTGCFLVIIEIRKCHY